MDAAACRLPTLYEISTAAHWRAVEFISDLHLSEQQPRTFDACAAYFERTDADAVFLLGDVFEVWVGDDARHEGFAARGAEMLSHAATLRHVAFMAGNRDFLLGTAMLRDCGLMGLQDPTVLSAWGHRVLLTHGDLLCLGDVDYQRFRDMVRSDEWRNAFLARPLAERNQLASQMRDTSKRHQQSQPADAWVDIDPGAAVAWMHAAGSRDMVHGHTHRPGSEALAPGFTRHVLSDWDLDTVPGRAEVLRLTRSGFTRTRFVL
jgi:UDP-2,3-diacylglucosamine hydrolase